MSVEADAGLHDLYTIDSRTGLIAPAIQCPSPNCDERPPNAAIDLFVIHSISLPPGEYGTGSVEQFFCNSLDCDAHPYFNEIRELTVSSHLLIDRQGEIIQFVPFHRRAWHAGESVFAGRPHCNDFSIGIELEGTDATSFDDRQYAALIQLIQSLRIAYPSLSGAPVVGHSDVAPGRKTDPGTAFDWSRLDACGPQNA